MVYLSITRLKLKSPLLLPSFLIHTEWIIHQIKTSPGFLKGKAIGTINLSMWTATLWQSEVAMRSFYRSGAHQRVMNYLNAWSSEAAVGHQVVDIQELPSWEEAGTRLCQIGYFPRLSQATWHHCHRIIPHPQFVVIDRSFTPRLNP